MATTAPPIGWPLLPVPEDGVLAFPDLEDSVRQSIQVILLTRPGERLMRPQFGAGLDQFQRQARPEAAQPPGDEDLLAVVKRAGIGHVGLPKKVRSARLRPRRIAPPCSPCQPEKP